MPQFCFMILENMSTLISKQSFTFASTKAISHKICIYNFLRKWVHYCEKYLIDTKQTNDFFFTYVCKCIVIFILIPGFVLFYQALKLDTIVKGDAPTSLATTSLFKREVSIYIHYNNKKYKYKCYITQRYTDKFHQFKQHYFCRNSTYTNFLLKTCFDLLRK